MARKPLIGTVAENVLAHGTGAINIDACRVAAQGRPLRESKSERSLNTYGDGLNGSRAAGSTDLGRFPANVLHDGSDEVLEAFAAYGEGHARGNKTVKYHEGKPATIQNAPVGGWERGFAGDSGTAARFFYAAKASKKDRNGSKHPTVKPVALIEYLCKLVTRPDGVVLDPFAGSGTLAAAWPRSILIEREAEYYADILRRLAA